MTTWRFAGRCNWLQNTSCHSLHHDHISSTTSRNQHSNSFPITSINSKALQTSPKWPLFTVRTPPRCDQPQTVRCLFWLQQMHLELVSMKHATDIAISQTSHQSSHPPSPSAPSSTTPLRSPSSAQSSATPTAAPSRPTALKSSSSPRRPHLPHPHGEHRSSAPPSSPTVLVL